jgi:beta-galactosidase
VQGYYRAWWRAGESQDCADVSLSPTDWTAPVTVGAPIGMWFPTLVFPAPSKYISCSSLNADIFAFSCAAAVGLSVNGVPQGSPQPVPLYGYVTWPGVRFAPGNISATSYDADGKPLRTTTVASVGPATALLLTVAHPYGPGRNASVISADGEDAALLSVAVVDAAGVLQPTAAAAVNVTFTVTAGPAVVLATSSGDPSDHVPGHSSSRLTYHGLARAVVASAAPAGQTGTIVVTASAPGFPDATVTLTAE